MDDMDNFDLLSAEKVAAKYGGDKRKIGQAAQMGLVNPTVAVMAGMFIDRMRGAAVQEQQPSTTVAQDVMAPATQMAGLGATSQANTQMAAVPTGTRTLAEGGLTALPVNEDMFPDEYAGGGIVAFQNEGLLIPCLVRLIWETHMLENALLLSMRCLQKNLRFQNFKSIIVPVKFQID
jgi:hypothetical protein